MSTKAQKMIDAELARLRKASGRKKLASGYAFKLEGRGSWKTASDEKWDTEMVGEEEIESSKHVGSRTIDGIRHNVFKGPHGVFAQVALG